MPAVMNTLTLTVKTVPRRGEQKVLVELDAERFERLAAGLGFFRSEFVVSIDRAEREITEGKIKRLRGLKYLSSL